MTRLWIDTNRVERFLVVFIQKYKGAIRTILQETIDFYVRVCVVTLSVELVTIIICQFIF